MVVNPGWVKTDMGGPNATLTAQESVTAIRQLIEKLGPDHTGMFFHYDGTRKPRSRRQSSRVQRNDAEQQSKRQRAGNTSATTP